MANGHSLTFISPKQIAAELNVNYQAFLRKLGRGEGPRFKKYGRQFKIRTDWYETWLEANDQPKGK
jgi:hypothetical protein